MQGFEIPVVLFMFRRVDTLLQIVDRVRQIRPLKMYLLSDNGRDSQEKEEVSECRRKIESAIDWPCEVIKNYAEANRGVHANIGLGAEWVLQREKWAIFLEDDNLPEVTFFTFCRELLVKYENDTHILWICGTNYLGKYTPKNKASYMFTQHLLPCGWASWSSKFLRFYDANLDLASDCYIMDNCKGSYKDHRLFKQQYESIMREKKRKDNGLRFGSWDYHMALTIRANGLLGISPALNQIRNIGVDVYSIHGGSDAASIMTKRFCGMPSYPMSMPLSHPKTVLVDCAYEKRISNIILLPMRYRIKSYAVKLSKRILRIQEDESFVKAIKARLWKQ